MNFTNNKSLQFTIIIFTILSTIGFAFITPLGTDSGWIANTTKRIADTGEFLWTAQFVNIAFGKVYFYINSLLINTIDKYFVLKIIPTLLTLIAIYLFYRFVLEIFKDKLIATLSLWLIIMFGVSTSIMLGLRTEGLYIPILFILFYLIYQYDITSKYIYLYISTVLTSLTAITHPNGFVLIGLLFIYVIIKLMYKKISWVHIIINTVLISIIVTYGLLWQTNLTEFIEGFNAIAKDDGHTIPFYKEYLRYISFVRDYTYLSIPMFIGLFGIYLFIRDYFKKSLEINLPKDFSKFIVYGSIFVFFYLTVIGVKWGYYLALLFPYFIIGLLYVVRYYNLDKKIIILLHLLLVILIINLILTKLPQNEDFLKLVHLPSERIAIVNDIKTLTKDKVVLAPAKTFYLFYKNSHFIQVEKMKCHKIDEKLDYVFISFGISYKDYEKDLGVKLKYNRSFIYNDARYNLFEVGE